MYKLILATIVIALAALIATGCGGSGSAPTKAEFIKQADAICKKAEREKQAKLEAFFQENTQPAEKQLSLKESAKFATNLATRATLPPLRVEADELSGLDVPSKEEGKANAITKEFDEAIKNLEANPARLSVRPDPFEKVAKMARAYGFKTCLLYY